MGLLSLADISSSSHPRLSLTLCLSLVPVSPSPPVSASPLPHLSLMPSAGSMDGREKGGPYKKNGFSIQLAPHEKAHIFPAQLSRRATRNQSHILGP
jgi:hypothetical protein